jgi:GT2 family glycosyltransferase
MIEPSVAVVTVTYGARAHLIRQVIAALRKHSERICDIVVIDNASIKPTESETGEPGPRVHCIRLADNSGSANGFRVGIEFAMEHTNAELIWLLDDDNVPVAECLEKLLAAYHMLGKGDVAVAGLRPSLRESVLATLGLMELRIPRNSFLGFHIALVPTKILRRLRGRIALAKGGECLLPLVLAEYAPYGGLLLSRKMIETIGVPNPDFFLYADDYEYTSRISRSGGRLFLCASAVVEDIDVSWHKEMTRSHFLLSPHSNEMKVYFSTRNRVFLEVTRYVTSPTLYAINRFVYLTGLIVHAVLVERDRRSIIRRVRLLRHAVSDGLSGKLGREGFALTA